MHAGQGRTSFAGSSLFTPATDGAAAEHAVPRSSILQGQSAGTLPNAPSQQPPRRSLFAASADALSLPEERRIGALGAENAAVVVYGAGSQLLPQVVNVASRFGRVVAVDVQPGVGVKVQFASPDEAATMTQMPASMPLAADST